MGMRGFEEARERRKEIGGTERGSKGCEKDPKRRWAVCLGLAGIFQSVTGFGQRPLEGELERGWGGTDTMKTLISSVFYLPFYLFHHIGHFPRSL